MEHISSLQNAPLASARGKGFTGNWSYMPGNFIPAMPPRKAGLAHLLEHFFHLRILPKQIVDFLHAGAGAAGDALAAAAVDGS